jgi:cytidylate kinase
LGTGYLDSGAIYRILTLAVLRAGADPDDPAAVLEVLGRIEFALPTDPDRQVHRLGGVDVTAEIRSDGVTAAVSAVSRHPEVRVRLLGAQRDLARSGPMVIEGRDIGTVVVPDAELKIYLTAHADVRARRRFRQTTGVAGQGVEGAEHDAAVSAVQRDLHRRDTLDSTRDHSPLQAAGDAVLIDSSDLGVGETVDRVIEIASARGIGELGGVAG